jgi:hypothetical protein
LFNIIIFSSYIEMKRILCSSLALVIIVSIADARDIKNKLVQHNYNFESNEGEHSN